MIGKTSFHFVVESVVAAKCCSAAETELVLLNRKPSAETAMPFILCKDRRKASPNKEVSPLSETFDFFDWLGWYEGSALGRAGVFCVLCTLFPTQHRQGFSRAENFIARLHCDWKKLKEDAELHQRTQYHLHADTKRQAFRTTSSNAMERIDVLIQDASAEHIRRNRPVPMSICRCLYLAGGEGIALRGHRDDFGGKREINKR